MNRDFVRTFFLALGAISALVLLIVGIGGYFATKEAPIGEWHIPWIKPSAEAAACLDDKMDELERQVSDAAAGEIFMLDITAEEATSKLDCLAKEGNLSLEMEHPQVYFGDGIVRAFAKVELVIDMQVCLEARLRVEEGMPDATFRSFHLGSIPIPSTLTNTVMTALEHAMVDRWEELEVEIQDITVVPGSMTVTMIKK